MFLRKLLALFLLVSPALFAQSTTLSGTVTDLGAQTWNNGTFNFQFVPGQNNQGQYTWTGGPLPKNIAGVMNGSGAYSVSIPSNTAITPGGTRWQGTFCPQATSPCFTASAIIVTGATMTFNVTPTAIAISLISPPPGPMLAYSDAEISSANIGSFYYNLGSQGYRVCQAINSVQFCTTWAPIAGGGGGSSFGAITSGTNNIAAMICGTGCSLATSGSGTIAATTATTATNVPFGGVTTGTNATPLTIGTGGSLGTSGSGTITATAVPFGGVGTGTSTNTLTVGTGGTITVSGSGIINATAINGVTVTGTPVAGQAPIANSPTTAVWGNIVPFNQIWQNNGSSLPGEPFTNAVPPLVATNNFANSRIDISCPVAIGVGPTHSSGCVPDPTASGLATDYLARDMTYKPNVSGGSILPDPSAGVQYVAKTCNGGVACSDSNNGLSLGTAKLTPYAALQALPNGSTSPPTAGNGIVYVANDLNGIAFGGPVPGGLGGWWMFGPTDPNYTAGLTGWMRAPTVGSVTMECLAPTASVIHQGGAVCQEFWGGHTDNVHPPVWYSAWSGQAVLRGFGFNFEATGIKIGIDSTNNRSGSTGVSSFWLDRDQVNLGNCYSGIGAGPSVDIGGASFWVNITHGSYTGCVTQDYSASAVRASNVVTLTLNQTGAGDIVAGANNYIIVRNMTDPSFNGAYVIATASGTSVTYAQNGPNASTSGGQAFPYGAASIGINSGSGPGAGFVYLDDVASNDGGIWAQGGFNGVGLSANKIVYEGDFTHVDMSTIEILPPARAADTSVYVNDVQFADNTVPICGVESFGYNANMAAQNTLVCGSIGATSSDGSPYVISPLRAGTYGIYPRHIAANIDAGRRLFSPYAVRGANRVGPSSSWTIQAGQTLTNGILAPDGTLGASRIANSTGGTLLMNFGGYFGPTPALGSYYIYGVWIRMVSGAGANAQDLDFNLNSSGLGAGDFCAPDYTQSGLGTSASGANVSKPSTYGDGEWNWYSGVCKIITNPTGGNQRFDMNVLGNSTIDVYGPVLTTIAAGTISDNEAWELANNLQSYPSSALPGDVSTLPAQRLVTDSFAIRSSGFTSTLTGGTLTANRTVTPADASGTNVVLLGPITGGKCTHTVGTTGAIQETANDCGTGGGGTGTVTNALLNSFAIYTGPGTTNQIGGVPGPTAPANVPQFVIYTPNGSVSGAASVALAGLPGRTNAISGDTVFGTDRNNWLLETFAGSSVVNISHAIFGNGFAFKMSVLGASSQVAITPDTGLCNGLANCALVRGQNATVASIDGSNLIADIHDPPLVCLAGCTLTRADYSLGITVSGAVGTTGSPVLGNLAKFSGAASITNGDLVGDCTTSGTLTVTCAKVNGISYPAGPSTIGFVPVLTGVSAITYELLPVNSLASTGTSVNSITCTLGSTCDLANGAGINRGLLIYRGPSAPFDTTPAGSANQLARSNGGTDPDFVSFGDITVTDTASASGTNTYVGCTTPAMASNANGKQVWILVANNNTTTTPTYNNCSIGAQTITKFGTSAVASGDLTTTAWAHLISDGTRWQLINPQTNTGGGGGGPSVQVNGSTSGITTTANFNSTTPAAPLGADALNCAFQVSGTSISCNVANVLTNSAVSRWGQLIWSHGNGGYINVGLSLTSGGLVCTTAGDLGATVSNPSYRTCGTGATANTTQFIGPGTGSDYFIGTASNPNNLHLSVFAKISSLLTTRAWMAEISDVSTLSNLGTSDSPTGNNVAAIRFSSVVPDTNYMLVLCNASACNASSTGVAADTNKHRFEIRMNDVTGVATGCVDGTCVSSSTDYPNSVAMGAFGIGSIIDNTTTTAETLSFSQLTITTVN